MSRTIKNIRLEKPTVRVKTFLLRLASRHHGRQRNPGIGVAGLGLLLLATWTTNENNLYLSSLLLAAIFKRVLKWKLAVAGGMIGMVIALSGIADNFISFLLMLGVVKPPIAAIYVCDFFVLRRGAYEASQLNANAAINWPAFISRLAASRVGFAGECCE